MEGRVRAMLPPDADRARVAAVVAAMEADWEDVRKDDDDDDLDDFIRATCAMYWLTVKVV